jgi:hypothetical protein
MAVRRAEEGAVDVFAGTADVVYIICRLRIYSLYMVVGVVACPVSAVCNHAIDGGMFHDIVADAEEGGLYVITVERVQDPGGDSGYRAVVERKIYASFLCRHPPNGSRK